MTIQEEIRDIVTKYLAWGLYPFEQAPSIEEITKPQEGYYVEADELLRLLHSKGVVVKEFKEFDTANIPQVLPLIEEQ